MKCHNVGPHSTQMSPQPMPSPWWSPFACWSCSSPHAPPLQALKSLATFYASSCCPSLSNMHTSAWHYCPLGGVACAPHLVAHRWVEWVNVLIPFGGVWCVAFDRQSWSWLGCCAWGGIPKWTKRMAYTPSLVLCCPEASRQITGNDVHIAALAVRSWVTVWNIHNLFSVYVMSHVHTVCPSAFHLLHSSPPAATLFTSVWLLFIFCKCVGVFVFQCHLRHHFPSR